MWMAAEQVQSVEKENTALEWWTECLHSYLMSYFFSEVGEMRGGGGRSGCECTAQYWRPLRSSTSVQQPGTCGSHTKRRLENEERDEEFGHFDTSGAITAC